MNSEYDASLSYEAYEQKGYLDEDFRFFHIKSSEQVDIPYHYHDFHKLILVLGGNVKYMIEGLEYDLEPFDFVLVNRFLIHRPLWPENESSDYERMILYLKDDFLKQYGLLDAFEMSFAKKSFVLRFPGSDSAGLYDLLCGIKQDLSREEMDYAGKLTTRLDVLRTLIAFNRTCLARQECFSSEARYNRKVIDLIRYINENLSSNLSIDMLSDHFYMSKYHMMRLFKNETGYSIHRYISEKRILMARDLIYGGMAATAACLECGFRDYSSFSRAFKNQLGILPSDIKI
jgi:AraC-like DNA-binding protein